MRTTTWSMIGFMILSSVTAAASDAQNSATPALPRVAKKVAKVETLHGDVRVDDYHWLREKDNPKVMEYLKGEDEYAEAVMAPTKEFQEKLYNEMLGRTKCSKGVACPAVVDGVGRDACEDSRRFRSSIPQAPRQLSEGVLRTFTAF